MFEIFERWVILSECNENADIKIDRKVRKGSLCKNDKLVIKYIFNFMFEILLLLLFKYEQQKNSD